MTRDEANPTIDLDAQHVEGKGRVGGTLGGTWSRGGARGGLSHHSSGSSRPFTFPNKAVLDLSTNVPSFSQAQGKAHLMESQESKAHPNKTKKGRKF